MVSTTGHLAFVSRLALADQREVVELELRDLSIRRQLAIVSRRRGRLSAAASAFRQQLLRNG
jgi:DNA-binding transcriptional LysR family regulator